MLEGAAAKRVEGERIARIVRFSSGSRLVQGLADRLQLCNSPENVWAATDLHDLETGECYDGRGSLWSCNSRLCPSCVGRLARRNRKIVRRVMQTYQLVVGQNWRFVTLTLPDLALSELDLLTVRALINTAWRKFSRSAWFIDKISGGVKSEEFTLGNWEQIHYHLHLLAVSRWLDADELRAAWTKSLRFAFKKHNLEFECHTKDGLAVCHIGRVTNRERAIQEICKYITKTDSWAKVPSEQLAQIATVERMPRMFEIFGVCKATAKDSPEKPLPTVFDTKDEPATKSELAAKSAYLDTKEITVRFSDDVLLESNKEMDKPPKEPPRKSPTWRGMCRILPRDEWLKWLDKKVEVCREFRKRQLRERYAYASFRLLDDSVF